MTEDVSAELARLQAENSHLKAILRQHGITWGSSLSSAPPVLEDVTIADPVTPPSVVLSPAGNAMFPPRWKYPAPAKARTSGFSFPFRCPLVKPACWEPRLSAIPAKERANSL